MLVMGLQRQQTSNNDLPIVTQREEDDGIWSKCKNAPEKGVTLFALRLAVLEKMASGLGTLGFIWATVVLLGGFAITLPSEDFWLITLILLIEGGRIFSRSHELEWQHHATSSADEEQPHQRRTWHTFHVPIVPVPFGRWVFSSRNISKGLYWLQLISASTCVILSIARLVQDDHRCHNGSNRCSALKVFYALTLAEALLFLTEKAYWRYHLTHRRLLEMVSCRCDLGPFGDAFVERFFYDAYSRCINGSVFDGVKMDLVSFSLDFLTSPSLDEQLMGVRMLFRFSTNNRFADVALSRVCTSMPVMERLLEMLNWEFNISHLQEEAKKSAAHIVSKLAANKQNSLRLAGIPGALKSISFLLHNPNPNQDLSELNLLGLLILKNLAQDHGSCGRIGSTHGLLRKIINFTRNHAVATEMQSTAVELSLRILKLLATTTGSTGNSLRQEMSENVFTVSNIHEIISHGEAYPMLRKLGIEVLTSLAMDIKAREIIGITGGVIKELLWIFITSSGSDYPSREAGEALAMLTLDSRNNCHRILREESLLPPLQSKPLRIQALRILLHLWSNVDTHFYPHLHGLIHILPMVMDAVMLEEMEVLEVSLGLLLQLLRVTGVEALATQLERMNMREPQFTERLIVILRTYDHPSIKVPSIRSFVLELSILLMSCSGAWSELFTHHGLHQELVKVEQSMTDIECFNVFFGSVGISRRNVTINSLMDTARELLYINN